LLPSGISFSVMNTAAFRTKKAESPSLLQKGGKSLSNEIVVALLSLVGTALGSVAGIITANRLTAYRLQQLEEKVNKHNNLIERMAIAERDIKSAHRRLDEIHNEMEELR